MNLYSFQSTVCISDPKNHPLHNILPGLFLLHASQCKQRTPTSSPYAPKPQRDIGPRPRTLRLVGIRRKSHTSMYMADPSNHRPRSALSALLHPGGVEGWAKWEGPWRSPWPCPWTTPVLGNPASTFLENICHRVLPDAAKCGVLSDGDTTCVRERRKLGLFFFACGEMLCLRGGA